MQRLVKCCLHAAFFSVVLQLPAKGMQAPRAACGYSALAQRLTARRYSAAAGDALRASIIRFSQQAIRIKIVYLCLVGGERKGERRKVDSHARVNSSTCS
jgi:hypothetical protein